jgi:hypothetical protein
MLNKLIKKGITPSDIRRYFLLTGALYTVLLFLELLISPYGFPYLSFWLLGMLLLGLGFQIWRRAVVQFHENQGSIAQVQAMFQLFQRIKTRKALPAMRAHAISPDFLNLVSDRILEKKPAVIVECGAGVSTLINAYQLEMNGKGFVFGLEADKSFSDKANRDILEHELSSWGKVYYAPLSEVKLQGGESANWYSLDFLSDLNAPIDILLIDGPESYFSGGSRYPALPLLYEHLADDAMIFIDDARRQKEKDNVKVWLKEFPDFSMQYVHTEKGTIILKRQKSE